MVHKIAIVTHVKVCLCLKTVLGCKVLIDRTHVFFRLLYCLICLTDRPDLKTSYVSKEKEAF